ncbi:endonuclease IV [Heyndrickxia ginsengihumi]|uniref:Endonuclease IV n=1 Tax=Heyndrickxia ginsengihumi TaxID=363870 RepID=A0A0A6VF46_9BACI|nr:deoxyribonuclease IV [Heyndrickxia ginsengihumi]KHD86093.1 endonuclease IV [Heyndrickxia ginsengihumi]
MKFGCHISIKDGYLGAARHALSINASAFQYFPKNPRSLSIKQYNVDDVESCKRFCFEHQLISISHTPYPTNLTPVKKKKEQIIESLLNDLVITDACGSVGAVVHFGNQISETNPLASYQLMIEMLNSVLKRWNGQCKILLENNAGKPGSIGTTLEELVQVRNLCNDPEKIGFCFDTCHAFASGLWNGENWQELQTKGTELGYWEHLEVIHLNNCKYPTGSGIDRHAPIFHDGFIKEEQFSVLMSAPELKHLPFILETPHTDSNSHEEDIKQLMTRWGSS